MLCMPSFLRLMYHLFPQGIANPDAGTITCNSITQNNGTGRLFSFPHCNYYVFLYFCTGPVISIFLSQPFPSHLHDIRLAFCKAVQSAVR